MIDVIGTRLRAQHLVGAGLPDAVAVVRGYTALQAQDYPAAVWGITQRVPGANRAEVDVAYQAGHLIRTHVMRPTWHLVAREDLRWLLELTAPRVHQVNGTMYRQTGLVGAELARGIELVVSAIERDGPRTRVQLVAALEADGFASAGLRLGYVLIAAELDRVICSAGFLGKQHAYGLFDDVVPASAPIDPEAARRELAIRYFRGHGPATASDLAWWSGMTLRDARAAAADAGDELQSGQQDGLEYWWAAGAEPATASDRAARRVHLLPNYDEYTVAYRERDNLTTPRAIRPFEDRLNRHIVLVDGVVGGGWRNENSPREHVLQVRLVIDRTAEIEAGIEAAAEWYGRVNGVAVRVEYPS